MLFIAQMLTSLLDNLKPLLSVQTLPGGVDVEIITTTSPALDIAALCLDAWPAAIICQQNHFQIFYQIGKIFIINHSFKRESL